MSKLSLLLTCAGLWLAVAADTPQGVSSGSSHTPVDEARPSPREDAIFEFLTATDWCDGGCGKSYGGMPITCGKLRFLRSGKARRWAFSDVPEADEQQDWNFDLDSDTTGRILFGGASVFAFERRGRSLWLAGTLYAPCDRPPSVIDSVRAGRSDLRKVPEPPLLASLARLPWVKQDDFNPDIMPRTLRFDRRLRCEQGYRDGRCTRIGRFSIEHERLLFENGPSTCAGRGGPESARTVAVAVVGDTLEFDRTLYGPQERSVRRVRGLEGQGDLFLNVSYDGALRTGHATLVSLGFENRSRAPLGVVRLKEFRVKAVRLRVQPDGFSQEGASELLARRRFDAREVAPGDVLSDTITVVPTFQGEIVGLFLEWDISEFNWDYSPAAFVTVRIR